MAKTKYILYMRVSVRREAKGTWDNNLVARYLGWQQFSK